MELIDKILTEWSYRVHDGMPNPKNPLHIVQLKESLEELKLPDNIVDEVIKNITEQVFYAKKKDGKRISVFDTKDARDAALRAGTHIEVDRAEAEKELKKKGKEPEVTDKGPEQETPTDTDQQPSAKPKIVQPSANPYDKADSDETTGPDIEWAKNEKEKLDLNETQQLISDDLSSGNFDELNKSHTEVLRKRLLGIAGMGGPVASYAESIFTDLVNTLPEYSELYTEDQNDILELEKNINRFRQRRQIFIKSGPNKGKPDFPKPNTEESEMFEVFGWDKDNPPDEAYEYFAKRELFAQKKLEEVKKDPDSLFYKKGRQGFNGDDGAFKEWMRTVFDGSMATKEEIENNSNLDTSKPYLVIQSEDGPDSHDKAVKEHLLSEYEKHKIRCEKGESKSCEDSEYYKRQYNSMDKLDFHDTFAVGKDSDGRTTIYHISNKKASNITDPHNNTTPAKRIKVIQEAGFGETVAIKVGRVLQRGFEDVSDVKQATVRAVPNVDITDDLALLADHLYKNVSDSYMKNCEEDSGFKEWVEQNNIPLSNTKEKLIAIKKYVDNQLKQGKTPAYKFGKLFSKMGEEGLKKKTQKANPNINFLSSGIDQVNKMKESEKNMVKNTYKRIVNSITEADRDDGFPTPDGDNGPHTQGYITTVLDSMHINTYIENYDGSAGITMGGRVAQPVDIRGCLAELTGFMDPPNEGEIDTPAGRKELQEWLTKRCKIDSETGHVVINGPKGDIKLFKDEWRSAGTDSQKVASYFGDGMKDCMKNKIDTRRQSQTNIGN